MTIGELRRPTVKAYDFGDTLPDTLPDNTPIAVRHRLGELQTAHCMIAKVHRIARAGQYNAVAQCTRFMIGIDDEPFLGPCRYCDGDEPDTPEQTIERTPVDGIIVLPL